ncbi:RICIN domain-containing protein [Streptomyces sp. NPDC046862]|uniref:RICIN domain-containing protein n=1 Tax=Streptomyces sp. NPDC046862 TaxID=3154603 RepID=UPI0034565A51
MQGPGGTPLFQIRNVKDSKCLDPGGYGGSSSGTKVQEFPCDGTTADNRLWWLDERADGTYWIRNFASDSQCLDTYVKNDDNRHLIISPCTPENRNNHAWFFTRK